MRIFMLSVPFQLWHTGSESIVVQTAEKDVHTCYKVKPSIWVMLLQI